MRTEILGIIPARGGSKGIPGKNIKLLGGKPLLAHSIEQLKRSPAVTRVVVSTDDAEIARVAEAYGAGVVRRPEAISGDKASSESALIHVLDHLQATEGYEPDLVVFLQATSPLRGERDIDATIEKLREEGADSAFSACHVEGFTWRSSPGELSPSYDPVRRPMRQDLTSELLEENGSIYVFKPWVLRNFQSRLGGKVSVSMMSRLDSFQVDVPSDWGLMEQLLASRPAEPDLELFRKIRLLILDFDGVMTDNRVVVDQEGREAVLCHRGDGWGLGRLRKHPDIEVLVLSTEANPVVVARCAKLRIECIHDCPDKLMVVKRLALERGLTAGQIAFVGNDLNDLEALRWGGLPIAVADAWGEARLAARVLTRRNGGFGAVREVADWMIASREKPVV